MKKLLIFISTIALSSIVNAEVRYVTLKAQGSQVDDESDYGYKPTDEVALAPTDQVEIVDASSGPYFGGNAFKNGAFGGEIQIFLENEDKPKRISNNQIKNNINITLSGITKISLTFDQAIFPGQVIQRFSSTVQLRITTKSSYSISKEDLVSAASSGGTSVVIPEDADGTYEVVLESSTDMVTWTRANPGTYGGDTKKRFFRTRVIKKG